MKFDLIIIGNELLNGKIQDLNAHFLATELYNRGDELRKVHVIKDSEKEFEMAIAESKLYSDVIITTGGLGPTQDDLTKTMFAKIFNKEVVYNTDAYKVAKGHYDRGEREYNLDIIDYHNLPLEFNSLANPIGYAPGIHYQEDDVHFFATPGVPSEFQVMLCEIILPKIPKPSLKSKHVIIKTWKIPESKIFHEFAPELWKDLETIGEVSSLPHISGVDIGVKISGSTEVEIEQKEKKVIALVSATEIKDYIWHIGPESLEEVIVTKAKQKKLTIGFAESCTGGLCASRITDISGSSAVFWGSIVSYANEVKTKSLEVKTETLKDHGAVSKKTAREMALGAREQLQVDIAISTTGIAGPGGGSIEKPVGTVGIGVSTVSGTKSKIYNFKGSRKALKQRFSQAALMILLEEITHL